MRHCRTCGCEIGKGKQYCSRCLEHRQKARYKRKTDRVNTAQRVYYGNCRWCGALFVSQTNNRGKQFCCPKHHTYHSVWTRCGARSEPARWSSCPTCGTAFTRVNRRQVFCSVQCRPAAYVPRPSRIVQCVICGMDMAVRQGAKRYCSPECQRQSDAYRTAHHRAKVRRRLRKRRVDGSHTQAQWRSRLAEYQGMCAYGCGRKATSRDHIIPLCSGGSDDISNIIPACHLCNSHKSGHEVERAAIPHKAGQLSWAAAWV